MTDDISAKVQSYWANIYVGRRPGYEAHVQPPQAAFDIIQAHVDQVGLCVTVTPTTFVYTNGQEPGFIVGLINYPRFPSTPDHIKQQAITLARNLRRSLHQHRVSVMFPDETVLLGDTAAA